MDALYLTLRTCPHCPVIGYVPDMVPHIRRCAKAAGKPRKNVTRKPVPAKPKRPRVGLDPDYTSALRARERLERSARARRPEAPPAEGDDAAYIIAMERSFYDPRRA